ncbi:MAG TPA: post-transcriptional regulator [Pseudogracilibacillus sp.]|nr:post-transcriptional regulator [Pseudogracilibacillus sp.]
MEEKTVQSWRTRLQPALTSKCAEFRVFGYANITENELWDCLEAMVWKGNPVKRLHDITADIFTLSSSTYINYKRVHALQSGKDDLMSSIQAIDERN